MPSTNKKSHQVIAVLDARRFEHYYFTFNGGDEVLAVTPADGVQNTFLVCFVFFPIGEYFLDQLVKVRIGP